MIVTSKKFNLFSPISTVNCNLEWKPLKTVKISLTEDGGTAMC